MTNYSNLPATPKQLKLDLGVQVERVVSGIEMGILENGMPYLTQRGLAAMSGAARSTIQDITQEWAEAQQSGIFSKGRMQFFRDYLSKNDFFEGSLYIEVDQDGQSYYAYPDVVCMAVIEYFAFEAQRTNDTAVDNFRKLARFGLQNFIYRALDYTPDNKWAMFNARVSLLQDSVPSGYFSIFRETQGITVDLINAGLPINEHTIPDGSIGGTWGRYWSANELDREYGDRISYDHYFPPSFSQSKSNPQAAWAYPNAAWPKFQEWLRTIYLPTKYPVYILKKAKILGGKSEALKLASLFSNKEISN